VQHTATHCNTLQRTSFGITLEDTATILSIARHLHIAHYTFFVHIVTLGPLSLVNQTLLRGILQIKFTWDGTDAPQVRSAARSKLNLEI